MFKFIFAILFASVIAQAAYNPNNPNGQATMAGSAPVVIASNQSAIPVTGTFWQTTQPVSIATMPTTPVTGTFWQATQPVSIATLPSLVASSAIIGKVGIDQTTPGTTNLVSIGTTGTVGLNAGTNSIGTVQQAAITKGTQGTTGVTVQQLRDAGRNQVHYYTLIPVLTTATDTLQSLTGTKAGATVTATTTPAVVTTGKTFRVTRFAATYVATATSGYAIARLRFNTGGVVAITSPVAATIAVGSTTPGTANATGQVEADLDEGWEFAAGTGVGISVQGFAAVTATAVGYAMVSLTGYEY